MIPPLPRIRCALWGNWRDNIRDPLVDPAPLPAECSLQTIPVPH
jgi:hypothetical protein